MEKFIKKAGVLIEALPYIRRFKHKTVVIKYGGSVMLNENIRKGVLQDIAFMHYVGMRPLIVHGGGPFINQRMESQGNKVKFVDGLRVTDEETVLLVKEVLTEVNKSLVEGLESFGVKARGCSPGDDKWLTAEKISAEVDIGYVGRISYVAEDLINKQLKRDVVPVIFSVAPGVDNKFYNVNADEVAAEIAAALRAEKLVLLTDVDGIMRNMEESDSVIPSLHITDVETLIKEGTILTGMIPKAKAGIKAARAGVHKVHMINARTPHSLLLEIFTDKGIGTEIEGQKTKDKR